VNEHEREREQDNLARALGELRDVEPPRDLWAGPTGIGARLEAKRRRTSAVRRGTSAVTVILAAAAVALFARMSAHTGVEGNQAQVTKITRDMPVAPAPTAREPDHTPDLTPALVALVPEEESYMAAASALDVTFQDRKTELPEKELASVTASLQALDTAIATTRTSLADHPDDADLRAELDAEYEQKIDTMNDVLEWTTRS
jgi:hypothetical protein